jgi:hypothetical protein
VKKNPITYGFLFLSVSAITLSVQAHESIVVHTCSQPTRPAYIASMVEQEFFQAQLAIFESCMFDFIREQQQQAQMHEQSAQMALDEWANYFQTIR